MLLSSQVQHRCPRLHRRGRRHALPQAVHRSVARTRMHPNASRRLTLCFVIDNLRLPPPPEGGRVKSRLLFPPLTRSGPHERGCERWLALCRLLSIFEKRELRRNARVVVAEPRSLSSRHNAHTHNLTPYFVSSLAPILCNLNHASCPDRRENRGWSGGNGKPWPGLPLVQERPRRWRVDLMKSTHVSHLRGVRVLRYMAGCASESIDFFAKER